MALGWQGERVIYGHLGSWPYTDWIGDIRIDSIDRQPEKVIIKGGTKLFIRNSNGFHSAWYQQPINVSVTGAPTVQAKGNTGQTVLDNKVFETAFTATIPVSVEQTSAQITVRWDDTSPYHTDPNDWVHWGTTYTITFESGATGPSGTVDVTVTNPYVYVITSTATVSDWGKGYTSSSMTARVSYTIDGVSYNYTAYSGTGGNSYYSFTADGRSLAIPWSKVPDDETVTVTWTASTNMGSITGQGTCHCMKSYDAFVIEEGVNGGKPVAADVFISNNPGDRPNKEMRRVNTIG